LLGNYDDGEDDGDNTSANIKEVSEYEENSKNEASRASLFGKVNTSKNGS